MTLKARVIPCLDVKDGRHRLPAAKSPAQAGPRGQAKQKRDAADRGQQC